MERNVRFYICPKCNNQVGLIHGKGENLKCCDTKMELMNANSADAAQEKHLPVYSKKDNEILVNIGETQHPMEDEHYIMWVAIVGDNQTTRIALSPKDKPIVKLPYISGATLYSYCNKHGLWKTKID